MFDVVFLLFADHFSDLFVVFPPVNQLAAAVHGGLSGVQLVGKAPILLVNARKLLYLVTNAERMSLLNGRHESLLLAESWPDTQPFAAVDVQKLPKQPLMGSLHLPLDALVFEMLALMLLLLIAVDEALHLLDVLVGNVVRPGGSDSLAVLFKFFVPEECLGHGKSLILAASH